MNLQYLKYAAEVANSGSINKAAEKLYMDQSNLSRCIKELESSLGVNIFERSSRGVKTSPQGEEFLKYAKNILKQVDTLENMFRSDFAEKKKFSISVPRASYVGEAFSSFSLSLPTNGEFEVFYKETNALRAVKNILEADYRLGIIRYAEHYDEYYKEMLENKGLSYELITEFRYQPVMNERSSIASLEDVTFADLSDKIEIAHADPLRSLVAVIRSQKRGVTRYSAPHIRVREGKPVRTSGKKRGYLYVGFARIERNSCPLRTRTENLRRKPKNLQRRAYI